MRYRTHYLPRDRAFAVVNDSGAIVARCDDRTEADAVIEAFKEADAERLALRRRQARIAREARLRLTARASRAAIA